LPYTFLHRRTCSLGVLLSPRPLEPDRVVLDDLPQRRSQHTTIRRVTEVSIWMVAKRAGALAVPIASKTNDRNFQVPRIRFSATDGAFGTPREYCVTSVAFIVLIPVSQTNRKAGGLVRRCLCGKMLLELPSRGNSSRQTLRVRRDTLCEMIGIGLT
jgi:hypothetical protein